MKSYNIVLADDHVIFRQGIKGLINKKPGLKVMGEVSDGKELLNLLKELSPDMVILDISIPGINGIDVAIETKELYPDIKVLILTMHKNKEYLYHSFSAGAQGYLLKEDSDVELFSAIDTIRNGGIYITHLMLKEMAEDLSNLYKGKDGHLSDLLTPREKEILRLIAQGKSNKEISGFLFISIRTVENHRASMMKKLKLKKTVDLIRYAIQKGYIIPFT